MISTTRVVSSSGTGLPMLPFARHGAPVLERGERLVDRAVVAPVVHDDPGTLRDLARPADHEPVRVGGRQRELPVRHAEPAGHLRPDPGGVLGRQHQRDAPGRLFGDRVDGDLRGMARHAAGVAETQVHELVAVDVPEPGALSAIDEDGMVAGPAGHPVHRHPEQERTLGLFGRAARCGRDARGTSRAHAPSAPATRARSIVFTVSPSDPRCPRVGRWRESSLGGTRPLGSRHRADGSLTAMSWPVVRASGGPRERGRAYGASRPRARAPLDRAVRRRLPSPTRDSGGPQVRDRAGAFAEWFDETDVQLLPELEGIAEGAGVDAEDVLALNVRTEVMFGLDTRAARAAAKECTAIGAGPARTADGRVLVAQNWDWKPATRETCVLLAMRPTGRPAFVTLVEAGLLAKVGMNDAGLALATNALTSSRDRGAAGRALPRASCDGCFTSTSHRGDAVARGDREPVGPPPRTTCSGRAAEADRRPRGRPGRSRHGVDGLGATSCATRTTSMRPDRPFKDLALLDGRESPRRQARPSARSPAPTSTWRSIERALRRTRDRPRRRFGLCARRRHRSRPRPDYVTIAGIVMDATRAPRCTSRTGTRARHPSSPTGSTSCSAPRTGSAKP